MNYMSDNNKKKLFMPKKYVFEGNTVYLITIIIIITKYRMLLSSDEFRIRLEIIRNSTRKVEFAVQLRIRWSNLNKTRGISPTLDKFYTDLSENGQKLMFLTKYLIKKGIFWHKYDSILVKFGPKNVEFDQICILKSNSIKVDFRV